MSMIVPPGYGRGGPTPAVLLLVRVQLRAGPLILFALNIPNNFRGSRYPNLRYVYCNRHMPY